MTMATATATSTTTLASTLELANSRLPDHPVEAISLYRSILDSPLTDEETIKAKEQAILLLGKVFKEQKNPNDLAQLLSQAKNFLSIIPKAKTAKIVRTLIDYFSDIPQCLPLQVEICQQIIAWAKSEKRIFLKQALETRLVAMYLENKMYSEALQLITQLLKELKRLDDKMALVDVQLLESRVYHAIRNIPKAKASLTSARASANSIYCPPLLQASLDMQSGILHAEENDFKTAYSYFFETLEGYSNHEDPRAMIALKYMLLCKIMLNQPDDVHALMHHKLASKYTGLDVEAMKSIATALQQRSLLTFEQSLNQYHDQLNLDPIIRLHLSALYNTLLEQNILKVIEPYSKIELTHVAQLVKLSLHQVEQKLSQLILDGKINGIIDQGACVLILFEEVKSDETYTHALETIKKMGTVVESLYQKASTLS